MENQNTIDIDYENAVMPYGSYLRPAQIPIRVDRFRYLTEQYEPSETTKWIVAYRRDHFLVFERETGYCYLDAIISCRETLEGLADDDICAAIITIRIGFTENGEEPEGDGFGLLTDLVCTSL